MSEKPEISIPVLTDMIGNREPPSTRPTDIDTLIAELQTRLASSAFALTDELMRSAFSEMEAHLQEQISSKLRQELPELIDTILREHLSGNEDQ